MRPLPTTYPAYFNNYIKLVQEENLPDALINNAHKASVFFNSITEIQSLYKYANDKWTVKEVLQHIIDTERIFNYRSLAIARAQSGVLLSFDENKYAANSFANKRTWKNLTEEFQAVRQSTIMLYQSFSPECLLRSGKISDYEMAVLAIGFTSAGHVMHHMNIIRERYWDVSIP